MRLSDDERARVGEAVQRAERATDAEILAITAAQSDAYHDVALHWAVLGMLLLVAVLAAVPGRLVAALTAIDGASAWEPATWSAGHLLTALLLMLAVAFLLLTLVTRAPAVRMALTPPATKTRRVRRRAVLLFRAAVEARTASRTGALVYVSLAERRAEIVTDATLVAKVPPDQWAAAMTALVEAMREGRAGDGIVAAVEAVGAILAEHVPYTGTDPNELPDGLVEL